jgi:hypothetical protein
MSNYLPYLSDSDSDDDTYYSSDTESTASSEPPLKTTDAMDTLFNRNPGPTETIKIIEDSKAKFTASNNTTLVMISSRDRDTNVFPQPTYFTMRLPKTYKNIKTINITQLNLLNSFFNFTEARGNTFMYIRELGRIRTDASGNIVPNDVRVQLRTGTYTSGTLVTELNNALNKTPLFADISGGLGTFIAEFQGTGDYSILFNQPGPVVFNTLTQQYESNVAMSQLVSRYFQNVQTVGTVNFSYNECLVAYYYPVIKEMTASNLPFNLHPEALPEGFTIPSDYILFAFQGLTDPYILTLIQDPANIVLFDQYRAANTFVSFLVNKYQCTYNANQGRLQIIAPSLNDSIQTDLNLEYSTYLNEEVLAAGFPSVAVFQSQYNALTQQNGSLLEFYNFIHTRFTNAFGINFGTYTAEFFANQSNEITLYNTLNGRGWSPTLLPSVSSNAISESRIIDAQISTPLSNIAIYYTDTGASNFLTSYNLSTVSFSNASETTYGYTDIVFDVLPTCYTRVNFTSRCRQTISAMTIPRYLTNRLPGTEETYPFGILENQTPLLFEGYANPPYSTIYIRTDISGASDFNVYNVSQTNLYQAYSYFRDNNRWVTFITPQILSGIRIQQGAPGFGVNPPISDISLYSYRPHIFFQLNTDGYHVDPNAKYNVDILVETRDGSAFGAPIRVSRYRDRAAFMIDAQQILAQNYTPNPRHVFETQVFPATATSAVLTISALNSQTNYIAIHIADPAIVPGSIPLRVYSMLHDPYGIYGTATDLDYRQMPYKELPPIADQFTPNSDIYASPVTSIYDPAITQIGYDISGVSNNLLNYYIQSSDNSFFDPENIQEYQSASVDGLRYLFSYETPGSGPPAPDSTADWSLYFAPVSRNQIRDTYQAGTSNIYLNSSIALKPPANGNETLLVNWFRAGVPGNTEEFLNPAPDGVNTLATRIALSTPGIFLGCVNATPLSTDVSTAVSYQDISGLCGLSFFLNPNDIVRLNEIHMKFAYIQPSVDSNNVDFSRQNSPLVLTDSDRCAFHNQATYVGTSCNAASTWDDWYTANRQNIRIGVFATGDISGADISALRLESSITTMTLNKVTQVANFTNSGGTFRSREPEWGTYYSYKPLVSTQSVWLPQGSTWTSTLVGVDQVPTYTAGESNYPGYFLTHTAINNYSFIPRGVGIAPSVGYAMETPYAYTSSYTSDIPNSYTIVPFINDAGSWRVGSFYGVSFTRTPAMASPAIAGTAAPYYGPAGPFGWMRNGSTIELAVGAEATQKPYYWNAKVSLETLNQDYNPATDLTAFGGFAGISNEYQDTWMFFYTNPTANYDLTDISGADSLGNPQWRWGIEQNSIYTRQDDQSGYNFLSYIHDVTLRSTSATLGVHDYSFHVRGYMPTCRMTTGLRLIGKNYTDFGTATLSEIGTEIANLAGYQPISDISGYTFITSDLASYSTIINNNDLIRLSGGNFFSHQYADALINFDNQFYYSSITFGKKIGYSGKTFTLTGYQNTMNQYVGYYSTLRGTQVAYTTVLSTATGRLNEYVVERYGTVLPTNILNRTRITDPLPFSALFSTYTVAPYSALFDEWGLGWNLGFKKEDTAYLTTLVSNTFIRIYDDFIYLKLNPEMNLNTMGVTAKEDLSLTHDTFAEERKYFAKILLNNFGGFCRAAVQMPKDFSPTLGKYELLSLQLVDRNGIQISNVDCEYDLVLQITEVVDGGAATYTQPLGY